MFLEISVPWTGRLLAAACLAVCASLPATAQGQQASKTGWPCNGKVDPAYVRTAEATAGKVLLFAPNEMAGAAEEMSASRGHDATVVRASGQLTDGVHDFEIPLDSTIESAYFYIGLQCLQFASVIRPDGEPVKVDAPDVKYHPFEATRLYTISAPDPGLWKVRIAGRGFFSVIVSAKTELTLSRVTFIEDGASRPILSKLGGEERLEAAMSGEASEIGFQFVSQRAKALRAFALELERENGTHRSYGGVVQLPAVEFRVMMTGIDAKGFPFQRVDSRLTVAVP
jgi:hypothetical protein